jgi:transposase
VYPWLHDELTERSGSINTIMLYTLKELSASDAPNSYRSLFQEGDFYENLVKLIRTYPHLDSEGFKTRKQVKKTMMYLLFQDFNPVHNRRVTAYLTFKTLFPRETAIMDLIKQVSPNALAILLQRLEAVLMLEQLTKVISTKYPEAGLLTVHDAILTQREHAESVRAEMEHFFHSVVGVRPAVKTSELSGHKVNNGVIGDITPEVASLQRKVQRKSYQSIQSVFSADDSQLLRPYIPAWEGKTASTGRVLRKLFNDPKQKTARETIKAGLALVMQNDLTTTSYGNQPIQVQQFSITSTLSTTWRPALTAWEMEPPLYCLTPTPVGTQACSQLTDAMWNELSPLLPGQANSRGVTAHDTRGFVDAVLWLGRTGTSWRDLPQERGEWHRVYVRYARWRESGVWTKITPWLTARGLVLPKTRSRRK